MSPAHVHEAPPPGSTAVCKMPIKWLTGSAFKHQPEPEFWTRTLFSSETSDAFTKSTAQSIVCVCFKSCSVYLPDDLDKSRIKKINK